MVLVHLEELLNPINNIDMNFLRLLLIALLINVNFCTAQTPTDRERMNKILKERIEKFGSYTESLEKRSGIFGNKTKKDIVKSNEILIAIVKLDNALIAVLNNKLDYRTFETTSYNYDKVTLEERVKNLSEINDMLSSKLDSTTKSLKLLSATNTRKSSYNYLLLFILVLAGVYILALRRKNN